MLTENIQEKWTKTSKYGDWVLILCMCGFKILPCKHDRMLNFTRGDYTIRVHGNAVQRLVDAHFLDIEYDKDIKTYILTHSGFERAHDLFRESIAYETWKTSK